jgi:hypothetical protein
MENKFRNKNGSLTVYAFACGYIETSREGVQLLKDGCWHVKFHDSEKGIHEWESFTHLTEARKGFSKMRKQIKSKK